MKEGRLHLRVDERLLKQIQKYAQRNQVTLTALVERHFRELLENDARKKDAEQL